MSRLNHLIDDYKRERDALIRRWRLESVRRTEIASRIFAMRRKPPLPTMASERDALPAQVVLALASLSSTRVSGPLQDIRAIMPQIDAFIADKNVDATEPWCSLCYLWRQADIEQRAALMPTVRQAWREAGLLGEEPRGVEATRI